MMDVFRLRDRVISEYRSYSEGFIDIADDRIRDAVDDAFDKGLLWPSPRIGLNPSFEPGATVNQLVSSGQLHPLAEKIFRKDKSAENREGEPMTLHRHQAEAVQAAADERSYVLTTGTGSGKSLAYIVPIVDHVLRAGSGRGIKALVLYPMNALANSQNEELSKFLDHGPWAAQHDGIPLASEALGNSRPVSFAVFTGQQKAAIGAHLGHARHVLDRFHVIRWFAAALTQVRRDVQRREPKGVKPAFDPEVFKARFALLRRGDTLTDTDRARLDKLFDAHPRLKAGWQALQELHGLYTADDYDGALEALGRFCDLYETGDLPEYHDTVDTFIAWSDEILNWHHTGRPSNGRIEETDNLLQVLRRTAHGFTNPRNFEARGILVT